MPRRRRNKKPSKGKKATPKRKDDQPWRLVCMQDAGGQDSLEICDAQSLVMKKCGKRWEKNDINVYLDDTGSNHHEIILKYANEWSNHCAVEFKKCDNKGKSDIRVSFVNNDHNESVVGTDARKCNLKPTMNLAVVHQQNRLPKDVFEKELRRTVLHEFGHVLGLEHEHQSPKSRFKWNENLVIAKYLELYGWDEAKTKANVVTRLTEADVCATAWDEKSIMHYGFATEYLLSLDDQPFHEIYDNYDLSELDKKTIGRIYPRSDREPVGGGTSVPPLPTNPPGGQQVTTTGRKRSAATSEATKAKNLKLILSPDPDLAGRPSTDDLKTISRAAGRNKKDLLRSLGIEEARIDTLYENNPNNAEEACYKGLLFWENDRALKPVTWGTLIDALNKAELNKLANGFLHIVNPQLQQQDPSPVLSDHNGTGKPPAPTKTDASIPYISSVETFMEHFKEDFLNSEDVDPMAIVGRLEDDKLMPVGKCSQVKSDFDPYNKRAIIYRHVRDQGTYSTLLGLCKAMKAASANKKTIALGVRMQKVLEQNEDNFPEKEQT